MLLDYRFAYIFGISLMGLFWLSFFLLRKDLRKEQLIISLLASPFAPVTQVFWFHGDYWKPDYIAPFYVAGVPLGIEEFIFAFFLGGIVCIAFEVVTGNKSIKRGRPNNKAFLLIPFGIGVIYLFKLLGLNTIWASIMAFIVTSWLIAYLNRNLIKDLIFSSLIMTAIIVFVYLVWFIFYPEVITRFWVIEALSGIMLFGIPIEELLWFLTAGGLGGVFYEYWTNTRRYAHVKGIK